MGQGLVRNGLGGQEPPNPFGMAAVSNELDRFQNVEQAEQEAQQARVQQYTDALGNTEGTRRLSWDEYNGLSPRQQAAIDANTALYDAIVADQQAPSTEERIPGYDDAVMSLFGENGGSETYAPRTVALLSELGLEQLPSRNLDQFLGLNALLREEDLDTVNRTTGAGTEGVAGPVDARAQNVLSFSNSSLEAMSRVLAQGQTLLDAARTNSGDAGTQLFGEAPTSLTDQDPQNRWLKNLFEKMSRREGGLSSEELGEVIYGMEQEYQLSQQQIYDYLEGRLRETTYGNAAGGPGTISGWADDVDYLTPEEFRSRYYTGGS